MAGHWRSPQSGRVDRVFSLVNLGLTTRERTDIETQDSLHSRGTALILHTSRAGTPSASRHVDTRVMASIPKYLDTHEVPLVDDDLRERIESLLGTANSRQVWLMFLDANDCQLPTLMPTYVPEQPEPDDVEWLEQMVRAVAEGIPATTVVTVLERSGASELTAGDCSWLRLLSAASGGSGLRSRGPLLCHDGGVRWVVSDEFAI